MDVSIVIATCFTHPPVCPSRTTTPLRKRQNGRHFADDIFKCIFMMENVWIPIKMSLKFVPKRPFNNISALVQIMAWCRSGDKPLSKPIMVSLPTHICVTRPQWVKDMTLGLISSGIMYSNTVIYEVCFLHSHIWWLFNVLPWLLRNFRYLRETCNNDAKYHEARRYLFQCHLLQE